MNICFGRLGGVEPLCVRCGTVGLLVGESPVRAHRPAATAGPWRFCPNPACHVVFFVDDDVVDDREVMCQVGLKAVGKPVPVCFCFAQTAEEIRRDVAEHDGVSTIKAAVKTAVADSLCACGHLNPSGDCCLASVHRVVSHARQLLSGVVAGG